MKFVKEFTSQMVPEWHKAYMDYEFLKTLLKEIQVFKQRNKRPALTTSSVEPTNLKRNHTLYRAFSGLTHFRRHSHDQNSTSDADQNNDQVILVNNVSHRNGDEYYETTFLKAEEEGGEYEFVYFRRLDDEFDKVLMFYKSKVEEVMNEARALDKQMEAFIAFRVKVEHPNDRTNSSLEETKTLPSEVPMFRRPADDSSPSSARRNRRDPGNLIEEDISSIQNLPDESNVDDNDDEEIKHEIQECNINKFQAKRPAPLEILQNVKFNSIQATPRSTIKGFLNLSNLTELKFTKRNLKKAEEQLKKALIELYHKLRLLQNYSFLNIMAFSKIMKKYDKICSRSASNYYMKMVDNSYLGSSDEVNTLMERVEVTFIKHFSNSNRSKGMDILRPKKKREHHKVTFFIGFLAGCTIALILALILIIRARGILHGEGRAVYMETMFPLYSIFGFIVLHMLLYAGNIYFWRRYRVNYSFIFGFKPETELGYREVLLLSFCTSVLALISILANLTMEMDSVTQDYKAMTELLPLGLVLFLVVTMLCPFNIIYRSGRYFFLVCVLHSVLAPLYKVTLTDFMLADQLTSQVQALRSAEFYICYYGSGDYKHRRNKCEQNGVFNTFSVIIAGVPFWWRFCQCMRRLYDEKDAMQGYNAVKYFLTIVAVCTRTTYTLHGGESWRMGALIISVLSTIIITYWDIVVDWGLLQCKSNNRWLRDKLLVPHKSVYFVAIGLNVLFRLAWMQTIMDFTVFSLHRQTMTALVASLEIIRRGIWNFFRLENEHLNNVGKFRAFKTVPLPFNYDEDDDKAE